MTAETQGRLVGLISKRVGDFREEEERESTVQIH